MGSALDLGGTVPGLGPRRGKKAFTLPPVAEEFPEDGALGKTGGFSLHAGTVAGAAERSKLERLCRYISRPALAAPFDQPIAANSRASWPLTTAVPIGEPRAQSETVPFLASENLIGGGKHTCAATLVERQ